MGYDIFYDKQFVKLDKKTYIPMVLVGSNNCHEQTTTGWRRERNWSNFSFLLDYSLAGSMEQMLERQEKCRAEKLEANPEEYNDKRFGYFTALSLGGGGCNMTYGQYIGIVKTGCKKALTIEQLLEEGVTLNVHTYNSNDNEEALKEQGLEPVRFTPRSTEEMLDFIKNVEPKYKGKKGGMLYASFFGMTDNKPKWIRQRYFPQVKKEKQEIKSSIGYVINLVGNGYDAYLYSYRGGSFRYSYHKTGGKQYLIKKDAEKVAEMMKKRRSDFKFNVVQVEYPSERTFYIPAGKKVVLHKKEKEKKMTNEELIASLELLPEGEEVANMFNPEAKCFLDPLGVALHDFIKGCEVTQKYEKMQQALGIFREKYPEEYYVLLD